MVESGRVAAEAFLRLAMAANKIGDMSESLGKQRIGGELEVCSASTCWGDQRDSGEAVSKRLPSLSLYLSDAQTQSVARLSKAPPVRRHSQLSRNRKKQDKALADDECRSSSVCELIHSWNPEWMGVSWFVWFLDKGGLSRDLNQGGALPSSRRLDASKGKNWGLDRKVSLGENCVDVDRTRTDTHREGPTFAFNTPRQIVGSRWTAKENERQKGS